MKWTYKVVGGGIGAIFGPIGAGIGVAVGHLVDKIFDEENLTAADAIVTTTCSFLGYMANRNGHIGAKERSLITRIAHDAAKSVGEVTVDTDDVIENAASAHELFKYTLNLGGNDEAFRFFLLSSAFRVACADQAADEQELDWISAVAAQMGATEEELVVIAVPYIRASNNSDAELAQARGILGLPNKATTEDVKQRYRELSRKYHPDIHASADEALKELAAEKFGQVSVAYKQLMSANSVCYWGLSVGDHSLVTPGSKDIVRCFFCKQKLRVPEESHFETARCPLCQGLLLFEEELAHHFLKQVEPERPPRSKSRKAPSKAQPKGASASTARKRATKVKATALKTGAAGKSTTAKRRGTTAKKNVVRSK